MNMATAFTVPKMTAEISSCGVQQPTAIALLPREYETMFIFDTVSTCTALKIEPPALQPDNPKAIRGAKGWINRLLPNGVAYKETVDQAKISARLDLELLESEYSDFAHLCRALRWLAQQETPDLYPTT